MYVFFVENSCKVCEITVSKDVTRTCFPLTGNLSICKKLCVCSSVVAAGPNLLKTSEVVFGLLKKQMSSVRKLTIACSSLKNSKPNCMEELHSALNLMIFLEFSHNLTIITANEKKVQTKPPTLTDAVALIPDLPFARDTVQVS